MTQHTHRFWNMGNAFHCICGAVREDARSDEQRTADMDRATRKARIRIHEAMVAHGLNVDLATANLEADRAALR